MPSRQVIRSSGEVHEESCPVASNKLRTTTLTLVLEKGVASPAESVGFDKKMTDAFSDQFADRESENNRSGRICVKTVPFVVDDENSVEDVLKDG